MLYYYGSDVPNADRILIRELGGLVTEQQYYKDNILVNKETFTWKVINKRLEHCYGPNGGVVVVPPTLGSEYEVSCIATDAFTDVAPTTVVVMPEGRVTLETGCFNQVGTAKVYSTIKRSQIANNVKAFGRIIEDV